MNRLFVLLALALLWPTHAAEPIPAPLQPWTGWALWDQPDRGAPTPFNNANRRLATWPTRLNLEVVPNGASFDFAVAVFSESWVQLPGNAEIWPTDVRVNGQAAPVTEQNNLPSVRLAPGTYQITGGFRWSEIPQRLNLPKALGLLSLRIDGREVAVPVWEESGTLWLRRDRTTTEADRDFLSVKLYSLLEDGIPLWLETEIELIVSGKSREETIGTVLPAGWRLASVESPIPVVIDDAGNLKAQVRAGRWMVKARAFRIDDPQELAFAADARPPVADVLLAFRSRPDFRFVDLTGAAAIDVSQTTFPAAWREWPVYRWDIATPLQLEERLRGPGEQNPGGLTFNRSWWLDESGARYTFRDNISGTSQQIWRLDAASGQDLGSVQSQGTGLLITKNTTTGAPGVEVRTRHLDLVATGRMDRQSALPATGWQSDAESVAVTLNLPPGWRMYALLGADWVKGDWLTSWSLLDLFLLLVFALAVSKLWGPLPGILAFVAFAISYHEPGAPRFIWLALLVPLALLRVVNLPWARSWLLAWKWVTVLVLILILAPFLSAQVQQALYPQLEKLPEFSQPVDSAASSVRESVVPTPALAMDAYARKQSLSPEPDDKSNLLFDPKAKIQTGPGIPEWTWRTVTFGWNGPVLASQTVRPVLIPMPVERVLTVVRILLVLLLAAVLLNVRRKSAPSIEPSAVAALLVGFLLIAPATANAQFPDAAMLDTLRERLLKPDDAYPNAADISAVALKIEGGRLAMDVTVQTALEVGVPLPGRLPAWSPVSLSVNGKPQAALRRDDGYLWVVLPKGVHQVRVEGLLPAATEWEWTFLLKPRQVTVEAPEWNFTGIRPNGVPEHQIFFSLKQRGAASEASYDRQDLQNLLRVERRIELGLVWQVRTTVSRITPSGRAISATIPLLAGENVLTANANVDGDSIQVRLGSNDASFVWESELAVTPSLALRTRASDSWVEQWTLVVSPVWNIGIEGLAPTFQPGTPELVPVWKPWPGENVTLTVTRPEAIPGETITVHRALHEISIGRRQRTSTLTLNLRCSLGEDFGIALPATAAVTSLTWDNQAIPVRIENGRLVVPVRPGEQSIVVNWREDVPLDFRAAVSSLSLPVESANVTTIVRVPDDRWVLGTFGPLRGPAVRFWTVLVCCLLAAWALSRVAISPLSAPQWMLLALGLTQVPLPAGLLVAGWLFFLAWRGTPSFLNLPPTTYNALQVILAGMTALALMVFLGVVAEGLLGNPDMFIRGNDSTRTMLQWYSAASGADLPEPGFFSVSIWWYRFLMLAWALWLAISLIRWLGWGWRQFSTGAVIKKKVVQPPPMPT